MKSPFVIARFEAERNFLSRPLLSGLIAILICAACFASVALSANDLSKVSQQLTRLDQEGFHTWVFTSAGEPIQAEACERINQVSSVESAGAVIRNRQVAPTLMPNMDVMEKTVTSGYLRAVWGPGAESSAGYRNYVGMDLGQRAGLRSGSTFSYFDKTLDATTVIEVDWIADRAGRVPGAQLQIFLLGPAEGIALECVVTIAPSERDQTLNLLTSWLGTDITVSQAGSSSVELVEPQQLLDARISKYLWLVSGIVVWILLCFLWFSRRSEYALYRTVGLDSAGELRMLAWEAAWLGIFPAALGSGIALLLFAKGAYLDVLWVQLALDWVRLLLVISMAPLLGSLILPKKSVLDRLDGA